MVEKMMMLGQPMNFQVVLLAGGISKKLFPLVSKEVPKAMLLIGNRPLLSYSLELLEASNLKNLIVVVAGTDVAEQVRGWIAGAYEDRLLAEVVPVTEDAGTADAIRAVGHRLTAEHILVVSGDLVSDVPLGAVAATHCRKRASMTALLFTHQAAGSSDGCATAGGKDKGKQQSPSDIIGLDPSCQHLTFLASASQIEKEIRIQKSLLRVCGRVELHTDLVDAHLYVFKRAILQDVLKQRPGIHSIKRELVPFILRSQMGLQLALSQAGENGGGEGLQALEKSVPSQLLHSSLVGAISNHLNCCAYIVNKDKYCARVNSIQAFNDVNHDVVGERAVHISGYEFSRNNNVIHPTAKLGYRATVGPHCMLGEGSELGDKSSIKRSVVGRHCRIGSGVKIMNSVVMDYVTLEDGCQVLASVICSNAHLNERVTLKDCQVGPAYTIAAGEHQGEALAKRERT